MKRIRPRPAPRRGLLALTMVLMTALLGPIAPATAAAEPMIWGAHVARRGGESEQQAVQNLEASLGQSLRGSRIFVLWDQQFPDSYHNWLRSTNHTLLLSVKARRLNGQRIPWSSIANAAPGQAIYDDIVSWSTRIKNWGAPIYFIFNHEPEASTNLQNGDATDFKNAWRRIVTVFREQGVTNAKYLLTMTDYSFFVNPTDRRRAEKWYPGDDVVDGIGADSYNWYTCRGSNEGWKSLQSIIDPLRQFGTQHPDEELWLPEFATIEDPAQPNRKAAWLAAAQSLFKQPGWEQFRGALYFHTEHDNSQYPACDWWADSSAQSRDAFAAMGADPYFGGEGEPPPPPAGSGLLFVVGDPAALTTGDTAVRNRLTAAGHTVTLADDGTVTAGDATGQAAVLISASVSSSLTSRFRDVTVPVLTWKPWIYDDMRMTGTTADVSYGNISASSAAITAAGHPLAAGRTGTVGLYATNQTIGFGIPNTGAGGATTVATVSGQPGIFVYESGASMVGGAPAPGCRIAFPASATSPAAFESGGGALFDAAVGYAAGNCAAP